MTITKCDICHKTIQNNDYVIAGDKGFLTRFSFCNKCGAPIILFLKKNDLIDEATESKLTYHEKEYHKKQGKTSKPRK